MVLPNTTVTVIGAGLSGLTAARRLSRAKLKVKLLDASDRIGGRIKTDQVEGFLLDHGFQVFLTGYETARKELRLDQLQLSPFMPGATVYYSNRFYRMDDPWRTPWYRWPAMAATLFSPIGSLLDKLRIAQFRSSVIKQSSAELLSQPEQTSVAFLRQFGFNDQMIDRFFRPFFGGVFLENELTTSSRMLKFLFKTFSTGLATLPLGGMQAIPAQIAMDLPADSIRLNATVTSLHRFEQQVRLVLSDGEEVESDYCIVAAEQPAARRLLQPFGDLPSGKSVGATCCLYFAMSPDSMKSFPTSSPLLMLNGSGSGLINNVSIPTLAQPSYGPKDQHLLSVSTVGVTELSSLDLLRQIQAELEAWFGKVAKSWRHLRTYRIPFSLPNQSVGLEDRFCSKMSERIFVCGDYCKTASIEGAIESGLSTANHLLDSLEKNST